MATLLDALSWILIAVGGLFSIIGGVGLLRLPDFYCRLHGAGVTDTLGAGSLLLGLVLQADGALVAVKLLMILFFLLVTSPTSAHALAKAAAAHGLRPWVPSEEDSSSAS